MAGYSQADLDDLKIQTPLLRLGTPEDIAARALFLASEAANFLTAQVIKPQWGDGDLNTKLKGFIFNRKS